MAELLWGYTAYALLTGTVCALIAPRKGWTGEAAYVLAAVVGALGIVFLLFQRDVARD